MSRFPRKTAQLKLFIDTQKVGGVGNALRPQAGRVVGSRPLNCLRAVAPKKCPHGSEVRCALPKSFRRTFITERVLMNTRFRSSILARDVSQPHERVLIKIVRPKQYAEDWFYVSEQLMFQQNILHPHLMRIND